MDKLSLGNPLFATYAIAASLMILKVVTMAWLTVWRMTREKGGFRSPEDLEKTALNPAPDPSQLLPNERVERVRRIMQNDLENVPFFLVAGFLYILTQPSLAAGAMAALRLRRLALPALRGLLHRTDPRHPRRHLDRGLADPGLHDGALAARGARGLTLLQHADSALGGEVAFEHLVLLEEPQGA